MMNTPPASPSGVEPVHSAGRNWCFTLFGHGDRDVHICESWQTNSQVRVAVVGIEVCPSTGRLHLQGVVGFVNPVRFAYMRTLFAGRAHIEPAVSLDASVVYCRKESNMVIDKDERVGRGKRADLTDLVDALKEGGLLRAKEVCPETLIKYPTGAKLFVSTAVPLARPTLRVHTLIGDPGCGKTRWCHDTFPDAFWFTPTVGGQVWFDGYSGQSVIIIDDILGPRTMAFGFFIRLLDRYPLMLAVKGGYVPCAASVIVCTSNDHPQFWYPGETVDAVLRRTIRDVGRLVQPNSDGIGFAALDIVECD